MERTKVLIVDDETDFSSTLAERFELRGYESITAESGAESLALLENGWRPDVVILDLKMPGLDGLATLKLLKETAPDVEVIMLTGHGSTTSGIEGMKRGLFDYISKPVDIDELLEVMTKAIGRKRGR